MVYQTKVESQVSSSAENQWRICLLKVW